MTLVPLRELTLLLVTFVASFQEFRGEFDFESFLFSFFIDETLVGKLKKNRLDKIMGSITKHIR